MSDVIFDVDYCDACPFNNKAYECVRKDIRQVYKDFISYIHSQQSEQEY